MIGIFVERVVWLVDSSVFICLAFQSFSSACRATFKMVIVGFKRTMMWSIQILKQTSVVSTINHWLRISIILHKLRRRTSRNSLTVLILLWRSLLSLDNWFKSRSSSLMTSFSFRIRRQSLPATSTNVLQYSFTTTLSSVRTFVDDCIFIDVHSRCGFILMLLSSAKSAFHEWMFESKTETNSIVFVFITSSFWF